MQKIFVNLLKCEGHSSSATACSYLHFVFPLVNSYETTEGCIPTLVGKELEMVSIHCLKCDIPTKPLRITQKHPRIKSHNEPIAVVS